VGVLPRADIPSREPGNPFGSPAGVGVLAALDACPLGYHAVLEASGFILFHGGFLGAAQFVYAAMWCLDDAKT
jgi:hypothetical protein